MPKFSETSKRRLASCHSDLQKLFNTVIQFYDCTIVCGYRGPTEQNLAFKGGKSKLQFPDSKHNRSPSLAVDAAPYEKYGIDWTREQGYFFAGFVLGIAKILKKHGVIDSKIRLGADWDSDHDINDQTFLDIPHFEIL